MNYLKYTNEEGLITYLQTSGIIDADISFNTGLCFINLSAMNKGQESTLAIIFSLDLEDENHFNLLTEDDYIHITEELKSNFTKAFEESLKSNNPILCLNPVLCGIIHSTSMFAREMVMKRIKELYRKQ